MIDVMMEESSLRGREGERERGGEGRNNCINSYYWVPHTTRKKLKFK